VDVAQDIVINAEDCGTEEYDIVTLADSQKMNKPFDRRLFGRVVAENLKDAEGNMIVEKNHGIDDQQAKAIVAAGIAEVKCRSVLKCKLSRGICRLCYGYDLGFNDMVKQGAAVGIVAAQAIGEPGTQLTMRTFHTGGSASVKDITQGLPRVEELFEAREPKGQAQVSEIDGQVYISKPNNKEYIVRIQGADVAKDTFELVDSHSVLKDGSKVMAGETLYVNSAGESIKSKVSGHVKVDKDEMIIIHESDDVKEYVVPASYSLMVKDKELVVKGQQLTEGNLNPNQVMVLRGVEPAQRYIMKELQSVYDSQGQNIHDKHIEVIVRQMFSKVRVSNAGDSEFVVGEIADKAKMNFINEELAKASKRPIESEQLLMGITKVSLNTESFLAAASFQETTRVLIEAAVTGKTDYLRGLKENVIIGKLIPAGTGFTDQIAKENLTVRHESIGVAEVPEAVAEPVEAPAE
jgi:DNA-directed RNA polymerase subunit beta'